MKCLSTSGNQNEKRQGHQEGRISFAVVADDFMTLSLDKTMGAFKTCCSPRGYPPKPRSHQRNVETKIQKYQECMATGWVSVLDDIRENCGVSAAVP